MAWRNASRAHPCSICKKPDWICRHNDDSGIVDCYRACGASGLQRRDKTGQVFWRHYPTGTRGSPLSSRTGADSDQTEKPTGIVHQRERADADTLHQVYSELLALLPLYEDHGVHLREGRKLTLEEAHDKLGYRSFPDQQDARRIIDKLIDRHGVEKLLTIPGFDHPERHVDMVDRTNGEVITLNATELRLSGARGILLPQRDIEGRIVGIMIRLDDPSNPDPTKKLKRYLPLTSYTSTGCAAIIGVHVPVHDKTSAPLGTRIIEGILKADIVTLRTGILTLGVPNGGRWEQGIRVAEQLGTEGILLTPDADTRENAGICATLAFAANNLEAKGAAFFLEVWPFTDPKLKGLDDVINAGRIGEVRVLAGVERWKTIKEWLASAGAPADPLVVARILIDNVVENAERDPFSVFKPNIAEAVAVLDAGSVEVQRLMASLKEHLRGSWRDFETKVKDARAKRSKNLRAQQMKEVVQSGRHAFKRGDQVEARDALLDELTPVGTTAFDHSLCVFDCGALYKFENGMFVKLDEAALITKVAEFAGSPIVTGGVLRVSKTFAKGAVDLAYDKRTQKDFFREAPHGVAFEDVFLRIDQKAKNLREERLSREHRIRGRYDFEYIKDGQPEKFLALLDRALGGKADKDQIVRVIQQFMGACIAGVAPRFQRAIIFRGKGNDAKSTIATILSAAMPTGTVSAVPPQSFGHPYSRAALDGMLLNCVSETPENEILDAGPLKAIITGDKIEARNPYERPFTMQPRAGQIFVLNNIFKIKDTSRAFRRRWILIDFENSVEDADRFKVEEVIEEVPAIVSWAIGGLRDLLANDYTIPESSDAAVDEWLGENDTVRQYIEAKLVPLNSEEKADEKIIWPKGDVIYGDYQVWVKANGHGTPMSSTRFFRRLGEQLGLRKGGTTKEGHTVDGNTYPVRFRDFAEMLRRAKDDERENADLFACERDRQIDPFATGVPEGDRLAFVVQARANGQVCVEITGIGHGWYTAPVTGEEAVRHFLTTVKDSEDRTIVTLDRVIEDGRTVAKIVQLRKPPQPN